MLYNHRLFNGTNSNQSGLACGELGPVFTGAGLTFMATIMALSILGNSLVCIVIARFSRLRTVSNYLVFSLAVSDMMVAISVLPFDIVYWVYFPHWPLNGYMCNLWNTLFFMFLTASTLNLLAICTDRFIAVVFALRYKDIMNFQTVKIVIGAIWLYSSLTGTTLFFLLVPPEDHTYMFEIHPVFHGFLLVVNVFTPFCVMIGFYFKIYLIARDHARRVGIIQSINSDLRVFEMIGRELRVAKTFGIVVVAFLLCWMPFEIINITILIDEGVENCSMEIADTLSCWFSYLQIAANPAIYAFANSKFRKAFKKTIYIHRSDLDNSTLNSTKCKDGDAFSVKTWRNMDQSVTMNDTTRHESHPGNIETVNESNQESTLSCSNKGMDEDFNPGKTETVNESNQESTLSCSNKGMDEDFNPGKTETVNESNQESTLSCSNKGMDEDFNPGKIETVNESNQESTFSCSNKGIDAELKKQ